MKNVLLGCVALGLLWGPFAQPSRGQVSEQVNQLGEKIDRGLSKLGEELSQAWADVRKSVERMGVQGRVYGRLHWDKALQGANLDIDVRGDDVVVLTGKVPSDEAKQKAGDLANGTIGVNRVVNELTVEPLRTASP